MKPRLVILAALAATSLFALAAGSITKLPADWGLAGQSQDLYEIGLDSDVTISGKGGKFIRSIPGTEPSWGTLMQTFTAKNYLGRRVRFEAQVKTKDVKGAGLWMRVDGVDGQTLAFYNSQDKPIVGSQDWQLRSVVLDVPSNATNIAFGVLQYGKGQVWIDKLSMDMVGTDVPVDVPARTIRKPMDQPSL